jgi:branched-chain amino acid transport system permease protein
VGSIIAATASIGALLVYPILASEFLVSVSVVTGIYVTLMVGLALFLGYGGQFSFAQAVFYGIGAYTSAILTTKFQIPVVAAFVTGGVFGGLAAFLLSAPILRLRGYYLAVATLACCQIFHVLISENFNITGGPTGIYSIPPFELFGIQLETGQSYHYLVWTVAIACLLFTRNVMDSRIGRALKAIQSSEEAALVLGVNVVDLQTKIFVFTGVTGGLAGSLFAHYVSYISPNTFTLDLSIWLVVVLSVGGVRTISGVVLGAAFTTVFPFLLGKYQSFNMLVFGVILILTLKYMPNGIAGEFQTWLSQRRRGATKPHG